MSLNRRERRKVERQKIREAQPSREEPVQADQTSASASVAPSLPWFEGTLFVGATSTAFGLVFLYLGVAMKDYRYFLVVAWLLFGVAIWAPLRGVSNRRLAHAWLLMLSIIIGVGLWFLQRRLPQVQQSKALSPSEIAAAVWEHRPPDETTRQAASRVNSRNVAADQVLIGQAVEINNFIGGKDEDGLWNLFGFFEMVRFNIKLQRDGIIAERTGTPLPTDDRDNGRRSLFKYKHVKATTDGGGKELSIDPGSVADVILPEQYSKSEDLINRYLNSGTLPVPIIEPLRKFYLTVQEDAGLLVDTLDDAMHENPDYFLQNDDMHAPAWQVINKMYRDKFEPLKPKADKVVDAVRVVLGSKQP